MAERRVPVNPHFDATSFTGRLGLIDAAVADLNLLMELRAATWEPHDWSDFDA